MSRTEFLKNMTVLLADDDEIIKKSIAGTLEVFVKKVITVNNGTSALKVFEAGYADIIILDIDMPEMNGLDVARKIRKTDTSTPIFIITSFNDTEHLKNAIPLMLVEYLIKPLQFNQIKNALINCIDYLEKQGLLFFEISPNTIYNKLSGEIIYSDGRHVPLTRRENALLHLLVKNRNRILQKEYLESVLFDMECTDNSLKNLVYRLKKKIDNDLILNVRGLGYKLAETLQT